MLHRRHIFTALTFIFFLSALVHEGMLSSFALAHVPRETMMQDTLTSVKQGVTQDGTFALTEISLAPSTPPRLKAGNHSRTLRAFVAVGQAGIPALYIESIKPHAYYVVTGSVTLSEQYPTLSWIDPVTIRFYGKGNDNILTSFELDLHSLLLTRKIVDVPPSPENSFDTAIVPDL